jgi:DNA-binding transcriptional ArsR family regulator
VRTGKQEPKKAQRRATAVTAEGRLVLTEGSAAARLFVYMTGNYIHRIERERREIYCGDLDLARVAEIIGMAGIEPGMREANFREQHKGFDAPMKQAELRSVNAMSIATAIDVPRQTVRRWLTKLQKLGFIEQKEPTRYVLAEGVLLEPHRQAAFARGIDETVRFMNELIAHGVVRWVPAKPAGRKAGG